VTREKVATFRRGFAQWITDQPRVPASEEAQRLGVPLVPVNDAADLRASAQYCHRGFFQEVDHPVLGTVVHPTVPYRLSASPAEIVSPAPALGAHTEHPGWSPNPPIVVSPQRRRPGRARGGPLEGVRVVELTKVWGRPVRGQVVGVPRRRGDQSRMLGEPRGDARLRRHRRQPRAVLPVDQP